MNDNKQAPDDAAALDALLGENASRPWWRRPVPWLLVLLALAAAAAA